MNPANRSMMIRCAVIFVRTLSPGCGSSTNMDRNPEQTPLPIEPVLKERTDNHWMRIPAVVGTAIGELNNRPCISIYVDRMNDDLTTACPPLVDSHPVRIEWIGATDPL